MGLQKVGLDLCSVVFGLFWPSTEPNSLNRPGCKQNRSDWHKSGRTSRRRLQMEFLDKNYQVDPYSPAKITENIARLEFRTRLVLVGSDVATEAPNGILKQGQRLLTPN
ncbi:hypothetical protein CRG98_029692 [Punica granatum]|uniref:Uncharacterized protein n=1 Tax=Punica granatum TaxID=22663 RepID=A0A2I0J0Z8_PUNGR|nr:hypothetical protein CRG98_029692 [Punica granatum]